MEIPVLIEPVKENGYRAIGAGGLSVGLAAEGRTRQEALDKLGQLLQVRLEQGAEIIPLPLPSQPHPWSQDFGWLRDDPLLPAWRQAMEAYRQQLDEDPDAL